MKNVTRYQQKTCGTRTTVLIIFLYLTVFLNTGLTLTDQRAFGQMQEAGRAQEMPNTRDIVRQIRELIVLEGQHPTTAGEADVRFKSLVRIVSVSLNAGSGVHAENVMPRATAGEIESRLSAGEKERAAKLIHECILRLDKLIVALEKAQPVGSNRSLLSEQQSSRSAAEDVTGTPPLSTINIHSIVSKSTYANMLKLMNPVIDSSRRRLYLTGIKSTCLGVIDLDKDELIETFDIGVPGGFLFRDPPTGDLYLFLIGPDIYYKIDVAGKKAVRLSSLPSSVMMPKRHTPATYNGVSFLDTGYPFKPGYLQDENAAYGVIIGKNSSGNVVDRIKHGPDALYFDIDQKTGKLYATNTGDGSISIFDLKNKNKKIKDIDLGDSVDELVLNPMTGGLYIRNRLGGSTVFYFDQASKTVTTIQNENTAGGLGIGLWPTRLLYDEGKLYILSHYGGRIDVLNAITSRLEAKISLPLTSKPRTDAISTMAIDRKRKVIYAAFPELQELAIVDARSLKASKVIRLQGYDPTLEGPARISLAVDEVINRIFVYFPDEKKLQVFSGDTLVLENTLSLDAGRVDKMLVSNAEKGLLYVGNLILDAKTLEQKGSFARGKRVIAFHNPTNRVYLADLNPLGPTKMVEKVYEYENTTIKRQWVLAPVLSIPSSFAFDFEHNKFYVGYFEAAVVNIFDLHSGAPVTLNEVLRPDRPASTDRPMGRGDHVPGRCGDGICQSIEREKGLCPEDCK